MTPLGQKGKAKVSGWAWQYKQKLAWQYNLYNSKILFFLTSRVVKPAPSSFLLSMGNCCVFCEIIIKTRRTLRQRRLPPSPIIHYLPSGYISETVRIIWKYGRSLPKPHHFSCEFIMYFRTNQRIFHILNINLLKTEKKWIIMCIFCMQILNALT